MGWNFYNASGELQINDGGLQAGSAVFTGKVDLGSNLLVGNAGSTGIAISANGEVTMAAQPAVYAYNSVNDDDVTGDNTQVRVDFDTEVYDQNGDFSNDVFTAPVTGRYLFTVTIRLEEYASGATNEQLSFNSSGSYSFTHYNNFGAWDSLVTRALAVTLINHMDAGDTMRIDIAVVGMAKAVDVSGSSAKHTTFGAFLIA